MRNNRGLTLIEVLLTLFILAATVLIFGKFCLTANRLTNLNITSQEVGMIAKNKMEEIKSGYIYIDNDKHRLLDLGETISFAEQGCNIDISVRPLHNYKNISCVNLEVCNEKGNISYNLIRYINLCKIMAEE